MKILLVHYANIPGNEYNDTERVLTWLGKSLQSLGHEVTFLVPKGSVIADAPVLYFQKKIALNDQIPDDIDIVHFQDQPLEPISKPCIVTQHENVTEPVPLDKNTVFLSGTQAASYGSHVFVHYGIDFSEYGQPVLDQKRLYFHFLGNASRPGKNLKGAIDIAAQVGSRLHVIGGSRVSFRKGLRITLSLAARFHGLVLPEGRNMLLNASKGLVFPITYPDPFPLAVIESLWFGCPIFGTPHGALPELLGKKITPPNKRPNGHGIVDAFYADFGCLSVKKSELVEALKNADAYQPSACHEYAHQHFSIEKMAQAYLYLYERILNGETLNDKHPIKQADGGTKTLKFKNE